MKPRHRVTMFAEIETAPRKDWLADGLLGDGDFSCVYGSPGAGKSVLVGDLCAHVAKGEKWFCRRVARGAVLYVAAERAKVVQRRFAAIRKHHGWNDLPLAVVAGSFDLRSNRADADEIIAHAATLESNTGLPGRLIVIDTYNRTLNGGDENSSKDVGAFVGNADHIQRATRAHVLIVHHVPHEQTRMRGHGALLAACDVTIRVEKLSSARVAVLEKSNDATEGAKLVFNLESVLLHCDESTRQETSAPVVVARDGAATQTQTPITAEIRLSKNQRTMFSILHDAGECGLSTGEWNNRAREAGIGSKRKADLYDIRAALKSKGLVRQYGDRWNAC